MGLSSISWRGNINTSEQSSWLYTILTVLCFVAVIAILIAKQPLYRVWQNKTTVFKIPRTWFERLVGIVILFFMILRIIFFEIDDAPYKWEYIPLHFCRFFIVVIAVSLIVNRSEWIRYYGFFAFVGGCIGLIFSDVKNSPSKILLDQTYNSVRNPATERVGSNWGMDNYFWWDFILAHSFAIIAPVFLFIINRDKAKVTKNSLFYACVSLNLLTFLVIGLNYGVATSHHPGWNPNWFYMGKDGIGTLGALSRPPHSLYLFIILGWIASYAAFGVYALQDKLLINFSSKTPKTSVKIIKSHNWEVFKHSTFTWRFWTLPLFQKLCNLLHPRAN
ncbi:YwaF family protein [Candidatus Mycoplasma pogonae]